MIDEVTDISNVQNLLTFIRFYDMEEEMTVSEFVSTYYILGESETKSADAFLSFVPQKTTSKTT